MENVNIYLELLENAPLCSKLLIASQLAVDDGDLSTSQKYFLQVKDILKTLIGDTFVEIKQITNIDTNECVDYDISSLNLAMLICDACKTATTLLGFEIEDQNNPTKAALQTKLIQTLNACEELYGILFN